MAVILSKSEVLVTFSQKRKNKCKKRQKQNIKHMLAILHLLEVLKDHNSNFSNTKNLSFRMFIILFI